MKECFTCQRCFGDHNVVCDIDRTPLETTLVGLPIFARRYRLDERVGTGTLGMTYKAFDINLRQAVAVKIILPQYVQVPPATVEDFFSELQLLAQIKHPAVIEILDYGKTEEGMLYVAMEYFPSRSLERILKVAGALPLKQATHYTVAICEAVDTVYQIGQMHGDLKPASVLVSTVDNSLKVMDFSLAKLKAIDIANLSASRSQAMLGMPYYVSPEQCEGQEIDERSEIYSIGIMLYHMLTGQVPFKGPSYPALLDQHINQIANPPHQVAEVPENIGIAVMRALEKDPDRRFQSILALANILTQATRAALKDQRAEPPSTTTKHNQVVNFGAEDKLYATNNAEALTEFDDFDEEFATKEVTRAELIAAQITEDEEISLREAMVASAVASEYGQDSQEIEKAEDRTEEATKVKPAGDADFESAMADLWAELDDVPTPKPTNKPAPVKSASASGEPSIPLSKAAAKRSRRPTTKMKRMQRTQGLEPVTFSDNASQSLSPNEAALPLTGNLDSADVEVDGTRPLPPELSSLMLSQLTGLPGIPPQVVDDGTRPLPPEWKAKLPPGLSGMPDLANLGVEADGTRPLPPELKKALNNNVVPPPPPPPAPLPTGVKPLTKSAPVRSSLPAKPEMLTSDLGAIGQVLNNITEMAKPVEAGKSAPSIPKPNVEAKPIPPVAKKTPEPVPSGGGLKPSPVVPLNIQMLPANLISLGDTAESTPPVALAPQLPKLSLAQAIYLFAPQFLPASNPNEYRRIITSSYAVEREALAAQLLAGAIFSLKRRNSLKISHVNQVVPVLKRKLDLADIELVVLQLFNGAVKPLDTLERQILESLGKNNANGLKGVYSYFGAKQPNKIALAEYVNDIVAEDLTQLNILNTDIKDRKSRQVGESTIAYTVDEAQVLRYSKQLPEITQFIQGLYREPPMPNSQIPLYEYMIGYFRQQFLQNSQDLS